MEPYYRPPSQDNKTNELFFKELRDISRSDTLVLMVYFSLPDENWEYPTADTDRSRRFLKGLDGNFLVQVLRELSRKGALLDLLLVNSKSLMSETATCAYLGHSNHEAAEMKIFGDRKKTASRTSTLDIQRADFKDSEGTS